MSIVPYQCCRSLDGWHPVEIGSRTTPDKTYLVLVNPWGSNAESICDCKGYHFRGRCAHQALAAQRVCGWSALDSPEQQTEDERRSLRCPRCGHFTKWEMTVVKERDDDDTAQ